MRYDRWRAVVGLALVSAAVVSMPAVAGDALAGHYYLSGVREAGSELLLSADGDYQWYLSYGAVDRKSSGTWRKIDQTVVLTPTPI